MEPTHKSLTCPISRDWLEDPIVTTCCGQAFSRESLISWFERDQTCPICRADLGSFDPHTVPSAKNLIDMVIEAQKQNISLSLFEGPEIKQDWTAIIHHITNNFTVIGKMELINKNKKSNFKTLFIPTIDKSGSMAGSAFNQVRYSLNRVIDLTYKNSHLITNIVSYCDKASTMIVDTTNPQIHYENEITRLQAGGGTSFQSAFTEIINICQRHKDDHLISSIVILFLTDGEDSTVQANNRTQLVAKLKTDIEQVWKKPFIVHTIGFTGNHDHNFLNELRLIGQEGAYRYADPAEDNDCISSKINSILDVVANCTAIPLKLITLENSPPIITSDNNVYWLNLSKPNVPQFQLIVGDDEPTIITGELAEDENDPVICEQWYNILISQIATELLSLTNNENKIEKELHGEILCQRARAIKSRLDPQSSSFARLDKLMEALSTILAGGIVDQRKLNDAKYEGKFQTKSQTKVTLPTQSNLLSFPSSSAQKPKYQSWDVYSTPTIKRCDADDQSSPIFVAIGRYTTTSACQWLTNNLEQYCQDKDKNGANSLIVASSVGRVNLVRIMVDSGLFDLNDTNNLGYNAIDLAILFGYWITFDILVEAGARPTLDGQQLLRTCLSKRYYNLSDRLIKHNFAFIMDDMENSAPDADIVKWLNNKALKEVNIETAIMKGMYEEVTNKVDTIEKISLGIYKEIFASGTADHVRILELLLSKDKIDMNEVFDIDDDITWPLFIACEKGNLRMVKLLIKYSNIDKQNLRGTTALWIACCNKHIDIVLELLNANADPNIANFKGDSPLIPACQKGSDSIVQLLLESGANLQLYNKNRDNPVLICCRTGQTKILEILLKTFTDDQLKLMLNTYAEIDGFVPLLAATELDKTECIKVCLKYGADIEERSKEDNQIIAGATALHLASYYGRLNSIKTLLVAGANVVAQTTHHGYTALHIAIKQGHPDVTRYLLSTEGGKQCLTIKDNENRLPFYYANKEGNEAILEEFFTNKLEKILSKVMFSRDSNIGDILIKYGQSPGCYEYSEITNIVCKNGSSLLSNALLTGNQQLIDSLLTIGADVNIKDDYGITPTFWQAFLGNKVDDISSETKMMLDNIYQVKNKSMQDRLLLNLQPQQFLLTEENNSNILTKMKDGYSLKVHRNVLEMLKKSVDDEHSLLTFMDKTKMDYIVWMSKIHLIKVIAAGEKILKPVHLLALYLYSSSQMIFETVNLTLVKYKDNNIWNPFVCCLYQAINLLPQFTGEVYRGIDVDFNKDHFQIGSTIAWNTFVICSKDYASSSELINRKRGIIFIIQSKTGRDVFKYSKNPVDAEVMFNPGTSVKVVNYYAPSIICLGQANIRKSTYAIKETDIIKATNKEACIIIELEEI